MTILNRGKLTVRVRAFTLVELLVTLVMLGILFSMATRLLVVALKTDEQTKIGFAEQFALSRLERILRADSLAARAWTGDKTRSFLLTDNVEIRYWTRGPWIVREVIRDDQPSSRDQFRLPDGVSLKYPDGAKRGELVRWEFLESVEPKPTSQKASVAWHVITGIGSNDSSWLVREVKQ